MASSLPYSRMIFEATCGTISELGLIKLSSEFSTLASPHATQLTSLEDYPKGVDVLRGLPEGSRLSPTLFGIFVADLVHELRAKFPHIYIWGNFPQEHTLGDGPGGASRAMARGTAQQKRYKGTALGHTT